MVTYRTEDGFQTMTVSAWETAKARSQYHFDTGFCDPRWDRAILLGRFMGDWRQELADAVGQSRPVNWETRGHRRDMPVWVQPDLAAEEYDIERAGGDPKMTVGHLNYDLAPIFQSMVDLFALGQVMSRLHVQTLGQVWNLHIDKLDKWCPNDPARVFRVFVQLQDWQPGQFWEFGNFHWNKWRAGDIVTFDWQNVPHSTANAGYDPRCTLQITGVKTNGTEKFLRELQTRHDWQL